MWVKFSTMKISNNMVGNFVENDGNTYCCCGEAVYLGS